MSSENKKSAREILAHYTDQPEVMPADLRERIEREWGAPVQLYALIDLDHALNLCHGWLAFGEAHGAVVLPPENGVGPKIRVFRRDEVRGVSEIPGLSCNTLTIQGAPGEPPLAVARYSHRQRRAVGNIIFVLQQDLAGHPVKVEAGDRAYVDAVMHPIREAQAAVTINRAAIFWRLLSYLKPYRRQVAIGMFAASLMTAVGLAPPYLTGYIIDSVIRPFEGGALDRAAAARMAMAIIGGIAAVYVFREIAAWVRLRTMAMLGEHVARDLRTHLYDHLHKLSVSYFSSKQTGNIISRVSSDTDRIWDFIAFGVVEVSLSLLMLIGLGVVLVLMDWQLGLIMIVPVPLLLFIIYKNGIGMQRLFLRAWRKWSNLTDVLSDTIPGIRVVKAFNQEEYEKRRFGQRNETVTNEFFRIHRRWTSFWPLLLFMMHLLTISVWLVAVPRILGDGQGNAPTLSTGRFVAFLLYMGMFFQPVEVFGQMSRMLNRALSSAHRIFEVLDTEPQVTDKPRAVKLRPISGRVVFENVTFGYDPVRQILKGISFEVEPGEMVGLVGPSGAGKTTIVNLLARFYDVTSGRICIDGVDIQDLDAGDFRQQVGMVLQDPYLFHGSIMENIRYGQHDATIDKIIDAARAANAHDFICRLPHGYDTIVGERGHTLSGGERQRVSIARAIMHDPRILILDEATSSVDTETERRIQEALGRLVAGRTVFAVAHRLSTLKKASRLFVINEGRLVEDGTHAELLAREDGLYRKLHMMQQELHEAFAV